MAGNTKGTCPLGGLWYTCTAQTPTFLGCCTSNPCQGDGKICPANDLRAAGMGTDPGPDPGLTSNDGSYWPNVQCPAGSEWWTCALQTPSFQGCCDVNPCGGDGTGCPSSLLHPAAFKSAPLDGGVVSTITLAASTAASKMPSAPTMSLASSSAGLVTSITPPSTSLPGKASETTSRTSALASSTPEPVAGSTPENTSSNLPIGAIAGGAGGGIAILLIALLAFCWCRKRRQKKSPTHIDLQPVMIEYPGYLTSPMAKTNEGHLKSQNSVKHKAVTITSSGYNFELDRHSFCDEMTRYLPLLELIRGKNNRILKHNADSEVLIRKGPGAEPLQARIRAAPRAPMTAELQEIQRRLTKEFWKKNNKACEDHNRNVLAVRDAKWPTMTTEQKIAADDRRFLKEAFKDGVLSDSITIKLRDVGLFLDTVRRVGVGYKYYQYPLGHAGREGQYEFIVALGPETSNKEALAKWEKASGQIKRLSQQEKKQSDMAARKKEKQVVEASGNGKYWIITETYKIKCPVIENDYGEVERERNFLSVVRPKCEI
ncbi:hypothetical protein IFR05_009546 [Cadophora sp. M221]|nr:hypothetical protein IFR05_009546 [Cadophora sp. M221]